MAGYSGTPLTKKLGIREGSRVWLVNAPTGFRKTLAGLPKDVLFVNQSAKPLDLILFFTKSRSELTNNFSKLASSLAPAGMLWIAWPKRSSGVATDLSDISVREIGLSSKQLAKAFGCMRLHKVSGSRTSVLPARCSANASLANCCSTPREFAKALSQRRSDASSSRIQPANSSCSGSLSFVTSANAFSRRMVIRFHAVCCSHAPLISKRNHTVDRRSSTNRTVDTKVCAIDEVRSGLRFVIRLKDRH